MHILDQVRGLILLVPIAGLLLVGLAISLRSGVAEAAGRGTGRCMAGNLSLLLLRLAGYGVAFMTMQRFIGVRMDIGW